MVDKRKGYTKTRKALVAITSTRASSKEHDTGSIGTDLRGQTGYEARVSKGSHAPSNIPKQYNKWKRLF
jgi:hypothetical protein